MFDLISEMYGNKRRDSGGNRQRNDEPFGMIGAGNGFYRKDNQNKPFNR